MILASATAFMTKIDPQLVSPPKPVASIRR